MRQLPLILRRGRRGQKGDKGDTGDAGPLNATDEARLAALEAAIGGGGVFNQTEKDDVFQQLSDIQNDDLTIVLYIDAINGDDTNDGRSATNAFQTWQACLNTLKANMQYEIFVIGALVMDTIYNPDNPPKSIFLRGLGGSAPISLLKSVFDLSQSNMVFHLRNLDISSDSVGVGFFGGESANVTVRLRNTTYTNNSGGNAALFGGIGIFYNVSAQNFINNSPGSLFANTNAGDDPNDSYLNSTNITSG